MEEKRQDLWLLAVDGSRGADNAARYVARTAGEFGAAEIRLLNVRMPPDDAAAKSKSAREAAAAQDADRATAKARSILGLAGLRYSVDAPVGDDPAAMIVGAAESMDATEIVMGTRGLSMLSSITLGSVAYKVVHMARRSVTLVPARARIGTRGGARSPLSMLVAVDGSSSANRAVQYAARQCAGNSKLRVVLLNVQPRIVSQNVRRFVSSKQIDVYTRGEAAAAMRQGLRILERAGVRHEVKVATGDPVETIIVAASESNCGRIVVGTRGYGVARSLLLGSVAYGVVHHADVPVTVVKQALPAPVALPAGGSRS